ncbi:MAG: glycosyltransferase family protein [Candidatus Pacearchaeota archaeon]
MRILYGVSGVGMGHAFHSTEVTKFLEKNGHKVLIFTYGDAYKILKEEFNVYKIEGLHLDFYNGSLRYSSTIYKSLKSIFINIYNFRKIKKTISDFKPELCITDMEFFVSVISTLYNIPTISLSNQTRFTNLKLDIPKKYWKDYILTKLAVNFTMFNKDYCIALSFSKFPKIKKNTFISPPIIRKEIRNLKPTIQNKIVVYLSRDNQKVLKILKHINERFIVYGYNVNKKEENLEFRTKESFAKEFGSCKAIISTSGFTSVSEALYLKKPHLAIPLKGQFEQIFNALMLKKRGYGEYCEKVTKENIEHFINNLDFYRKNLEKYKTEPNKIFLIVNKVIMNINKNRIT